MTSRLRILVASAAVGEDPRAMARGVQLAAETGGDLAILAATEDNDPLRTARRRKALTETLAGLGGSARAEVHAVAGEMPDLLSDYAAHWPADVVVIGGEAPAPLLDAVAARLTCPLLIVRNSRTGSYRKVLVGASPEENSRRALASAAAVAPIARFVLLRVVNFPGGYVPDLMPDTPPEEEAEAILGGFALPEGQFEWLMRCGKPKAEILFAAREVRADLVALGNTNRSGIEKLLLGNVALEAAHSLTCDVLIAHCEEHAS